MGVHNDILMEGRAQFITIQVPDNGNMTIINVYATRSSNENTSMWKRLNEANLVAKHIILGGDFNHFEEKNRRGFAEERLMHMKEVAAWHHMTLLHGLSDAWKLDNFWKMSTKEFTFNNGRSNARSVVSHIDKFLVSQDLDTRGGRIKVTTLVHKRSDHSPLVLTI
jgi:exonuclease III